VRVGVAPAAASAAAGEGVLFVGARPAGGGPPVYVARYAPAFFPGTYYLTESNRMGMGGPAQGPLAVFARFDRDGDAGTAGDDDLEAVTAPALPGNTEVRLTLAAKTAVPQRPAWSLSVRLDGPPGAAGTMFVLLRAAVGGRVPLAAARFDAPPSFPTTVTVAEHHILQPPLPPLDELDVLVKVDQDGNPLTTEPGDLEGHAGAAAVAAGAPLSLAPAPLR